MSVFTQLTRISAMDLRREPGAFLDRASYRNETFVIERAGKPKAVLVPLRDYEQLEFARRKALARFGKKTMKLQSRLASEDPNQIQDAIDEAIETVRMTRSS